MFLVHFCLLITLASNSLSFYGHAALFGHDIDLAISQSLKLIPTFKHRSICDSFVNTFTNAFIIGGLELVFREVYESMRYFSKATLKGFETYQYRARDTSPLSIYVMHPFWNWVVTFTPLWVAPNVLTFIGFTCAALNFLITCYYDWYFYASSPNFTEFEAIPRWVWFVMLVLHFASHTLDGIDGKQSKRTKTSSPLGKCHLYFWNPYEYVSKVALFKSTN